MTQSRRSALLLGRSLTSIAALALAACGESQSGSSTAGSGEKSASSPPNVVLITIESLRTDHVGTYGGKSKSRPDIPLTPTLDGLAEEAMVYEDAHSVTSWTLASHASLFTGLYPSAHQTIHATDKLGDSYDTLAEQLAARGYDTAGVISGPYLRKAHNLNQGFVHYHDEIASTTHVQAHGDVTNPRMESTLRQVVNRELDPNRPFLLFAYFWDSHYDYLPPKPYKEMFRGPDCEPIYIRNFETTQVVNPNIRPAQLAYVLSQYAGEVRATDETVGRFFQLLKDKGLWDNTMVIVTADHGDEFFDHGEKGHFNNVYAETVHVPLIVKYPKGGPQGRDTRLASLVDVVPTVLQVTGAPTASALEGRSLLDEKPDPERAIFYELTSVWYTRNPQAVIFPITTRTRTWNGIRRGDHKLVTSPELGKAELYDIRNDPTEKVNTAVARQDVAEQLAADLGRWKGTQQQIAERFGKGGSASLTAEEKERLRSLGYIQ